MDFFWIAVGLAGLGYFIGDGLRHIGNPKKVTKYFVFIKENELHYYVNLSRKEIKELLNEFPDAPKVVLNGKVYYPSRQFQEWLAALKPNQQRD
ncbi:DNA-binding protein [Bacillus sp. 1P06AnD]|uniref:DNA-binding protein n=1 Tax=Bacillus sp. 1P06AnD TaxID=3132208 RepID=UPI0039A1B4EC